jgi:hypothetical protein
MQGGIRSKAGSGEEGISSNVQHVVSVLSKPALGMSYFPGTIFNLRFGNVPIGIPASRSRGNWNRLDNGPDDPVATDYQQFFQWGTHAALGGAPGQAAGDDSAGNLYYTLTADIQASRAADLTIRTAAISFGVPIRTAADVQQIPTPEELKQQQK